MVVMVVSHETIVAASSCLVVIGIVFWISSSILGEAQSHFTRKCKARVDQEVMAAGEFFFEIFIPVFGIQIGFAVIVKPFAFFGLGKVR